MKNITHDDLMLVLRQSARSPRIRIKIEVLNDDDMSYVGTILGTVSGSMQISADSDVRRTCSIVIQPTLVGNIKINEGSLVWLNKNIHVWIGIYDFYLKDYRDYSLGYYVYTDTNNTYDSVTNQLTVNCADFIKKIDGTKNGQLGALTITMPAYEENEDGTVVKYNTIRDAIIKTLTQLGGINDYLIDDVGTYRAMPEYNSDYAEYRANNPDWNTIPYDQEFAAGCSVLSILTTLRDLYPHYEMFFDMDSNVFTCQMIPSGYNDEALIDYEFIKKVLISESTSHDLTTVRNVCEVWGQVIETDYYSENVSYANNVYSATIEGYEEEYYNADTIALKIPASNADGASININGFGNVPIYNEATDSVIPAGKMTANTVYAFKIKKRRENKETIIKAYFLGQWQAHAVNVLTDGSTSTRRVDVGGVSYILYSVEYFKALYNCERIDFMVVPDSPYTIQKLGVILDVKTGGEYDNIESDDLAADRARWENWKNARLTDNISITTILLPFLDVNQKITYKPVNEEAIQEYMISSISHDFSGYTSSIDMYRYYPLYES